MYPVVAVSEVGTGAGQNKCTYAFFLPLTLMSPSFATEALFRNYREVGSEWIASSPVSPAKVAMVV
jgi:hypothetical protein